MKASLISTPRLKDAGHFFCPPVRVAPKGKLVLVENSKNSQTAESNAALARKSQPEVAPSGSMPHAALGNVRASLDPTFRRMSDLFRDADVNADGTLSRCEFEEIVRQAGLSSEVNVDLLFGSVDTNADGRVSYREMLDAMRKHAVAQSQRPWAQSSTVLSPGELRGMKATVKEMQAAKILWTKRVFSTKGRLEVLRRAQTSQGQSRVRGPGNGKLDPDAVVVPNSPIRSCDGGQIPNNI